MLFLQLPPVHSPSTARPQPVHRILTFAPSLASSHAISAAPAHPQPVHRPSTGSWHSLSLLHLWPPPMLFLQLPPVHSPSTARPPDPDIRSRSSISSLLPRYFCSSRPSTARPPPVHRIRTFAFAPPSLASSHAISAAPARPPPVHRIRTFTPMLFLQLPPVHSPSTGSGHSLSLLHL